MMEETSRVETEFVFKCSRCNFPEQVFLAREAAERAEDEHRDAYHPSAKRQRAIQSFVSMMESMAGVVVPEPTTDPNVWDGVS